MGWFDGIREKIHCLFIVGQLKILQTADLWVQVYYCRLALKHRCMPTCLVHDGDGLMMAESLTLISHIFLFPSHLLKATTSLFWRGRKHKGLRKPTARNEGHVWVSLHALTPSMHMCAHACHGHHPY